jgi:hypothetical protein
LARTKRAKPARRRRDGAGAHSQKRASAPAAAGAGAGDWIASGQRPAHWQELANDHALYRCQCGFVFESPVSTSVTCPHCGGTQAW